MPGVFDCLYTGPAWYNRLYTPGPESPLVRSIKQSGRIVASLSLTQPRGKAAGKKNMEKKPRFTLPLDAQSELSLFEEAHGAELFHLIEGDRGHLRQWLPWVDYETSIEDSRRFVRHSLQRYLNNEGFELGIHYQGRLAGVIGLHTVD